MVCDVVRHGLLLRCGKANALTIAFEQVDQPSTDIPAFARAELNGPRNRNINTNKVSPLTRNLAGPPEFVLWFDIWVSALSTGSFSY